jgi:hypothetical protein
MKRGNRLRRAGLVLALLVLAAIVTGVAASAAKTVVPKQLQGSWKRNGWTMHVYSFGLVVIWGGQVDEGDAEFSRVTAHRLTIGDATFLSSSCSGTTGTYRWTITHRPPFRGAQLKLKKIHDACKPRGNLFAGVWSRPS